MNNFFKKAWPDVAVIALFVVLSFAYFYPSAIDGRVLTGSDHTGGVGLGAELEHYKAETGENPETTPENAAAPKVSEDTLRELEEELSRKLADD